MSQSSLGLTRLAVAACFFVSGSVVSSWVPHIPGMQRMLGLNPAQLGLVLFAPAVGMLVAMIVSGGLSARMGTGRLMRAATVLYCLMLPLTVAVAHPLLLGLVLALMGFGNGAMGVAMNAEAVEVERAYSRVIMSSFHALYSLGCLAGAAVGGFVIAAGGSPVVHLSVAGLLAGALGVWASFHYLPGTVGSGEPAPLFVKPTRLLALLGLATFCSMLIEGAVADWAGLYLRDVRGAGEGPAAIGFVAFSLMMVAGRLTGDGLTRTLGPQGIVRLGGTLAVAGVALALAVPHMLAGVVGFGLVGAGLANVVPNFFSASARERGMPASRAIAAVSSIGFSGFLLGPPLIGALAQWLSLPVAMASLCGFGLVIAAMAGLLPGRAHAAIASRVASDA